MSKPSKPTCDGDCLHCTHDDCDSGTFSGGRRTPFEREQSAIRKRYSKSYGGSFSPWSTNFDEMAKKTVLKKCLKYAPLKSDFVRAVASDETIKTEIAEDMTEVPPVEIAYTVDEETGEVVEPDTNGGGL